MVHHSWFSSSQTMRTGILKHQHPRSYHGHPGGAYKAIWYYYQRPEIDTRSQRHSRLSVASPQWRKWVRPLGLHLTTAFYSLVSTMSYRQVLHCIEATRYRLAFEFDMLFGCGAVKTPDKLQSDMIIKIVTTMMNLSRHIWKKMTSSKLEQHEIWAAPMHFGKKFKYTYEHMLLSM